ncbi:MAG: hypothetical protein ACI80H_000307 [Pseudoalteromonas distincta]|jgi:hypothetical protein
MIPKIIHTTWLSDDPVPVPIEECMNTWRLELPDFEIIVHNYNDVKKYENKFLRQCISKKMYAFASDYLRFCIINEHGGIYLDGDMLVLQPFPEHLLNHQLFIGMQNESFIDLAIIGSIKNNPSILPVIAKYKKKEFDYFDPPVLPQFTNEYFIKLSEEHPSEIKIYEPSVFYPLPAKNKDQLYKDFIKPESICVHLWNFGWQDIYSQKNGFKVIIRLLADFLFNEYSIGFTFNHLKNIIKSGLKNKIRIISNLVNKSLKNQ